MSIKDIPKVSWSIIWRTFFVGAGAMLSISYVKDIFELFDYYDC